MIDDYSPVPDSRHVEDRPLALIAAERERQVTKEGWSPEHDDQHSDGELSMAAAVYATPPRPDRYPHMRDMVVASLWPWEQRWYKPVPDDRVRELVKAGALIVAEIERLLRSGDAPDNPHLGADSASPSEAS